MKTDSVCKLRRSFLHFQKFVTRVLWIFIYVVKHMSSLKLPLFLLSYLGRNLNIAVWNIVDLLLEKSLVLDCPSTVWFLNRKSHCERSHSWSGEHWYEQWRSLSFPVFWLIFSIRPSRVGAEGDCQETYLVKSPLGRWIQLKEACFWWPLGQEDCVRVIYYDVFLATMQAYQCSMLPGPGQLES